jgi:hypothetical protein
MSGSRAIATFRPRAIDALARFRLRRGRKAIAGKNADDRQTVRGLTALESKVLWEPADCVWADWNRKDAVRMSEPR